MDGIDREHVPDPDESLRARTRALLGMDSRGGLAIGDDVESGLGRICSAAAYELNLLGAVASVWAAGGTQVVAGASDVESWDLEEIEYGVGEGPGHDAFRSGRPVLVSDLEAAFVRWPGYVSVAVRAGVGAVYTFPLQLGAVRFGVLTCHAGRVRRLTSEETTQALVFAELATEILLESSDGGHSGAVGAGLQDALHFRNEIYQAQGMVKTQLGVGLAEALARMRAYAFTTGQDLTTLAVGILAGTIHLPRDPK